MNKQTFVRVATGVFTVVGLVHLYRAFNALPVNLMGWDVPNELSWVVGVIALLLAWVGYQNSK